MLKSLKINTRNIIKSKLKKKRCLRSNIDARIKNKRIKKWIIIKQKINWSYWLIQSNNKQ